MLYSCMLVDDEEDVISAIRQTIDWESLGFSVPREAHNGIEALEFAEESAPDVVLTDIKMPYMDGLELAHKLKELYPNIRIIVFSGFDEFEYAREALRLEAEEYMLKPVHAAELSKLFLRMRSGQSDRTGNSCRPITRRVCRGCRRVFLCLSWTARFRRRRLRGRPRTISWNSALLPVRRLLSTRGAPGFRTGSVP